MSNKKNNKTFKDNMFSIFEHGMNEDNAKDHISALDNKKESGSTARKKAPKKKSSRKSFASNLEQLFSESLGQDVVDNSAKEIELNDKKAVGIDLLIKSTTSGGQSGREQLKPKTRRVTVVINVEKIEEFKKIAKSESSTMSKVLRELIDGYIKEN